MNKKRTLLFVIPLCILPIQGIFAYSGEIQKQQTLKEMQEEKQQLEKEESVLQFKWNTFQLGNESLGDVMKQDLSFEARTKLEGIINFYTSNKEELEDDLQKFVNAGKDVTDIKMKLLDGKEIFYKSLIPYIQTNKLESFKVYVDNDLSYNEKGKSVSTKIKQKNIEQSERLEQLQDKIDDNSRELRKKIEKSIQLKVQKKLDEFVTQQNFLDLPIETKIHIFSNMIHKFETAIGTLEDSDNPTRALDERVIGLEVVVEILNGYIDTWK